MKRLYLEAQLIIYLIVLRITPNLKGYNYLKEAVLRVCEDDSKKIKMSNNLYLELARDFNEKPALIDRALRHALEVAYKRDGFIEFERFTKFNFICEKPTAKELICFLAEKLNLDYYKEHPNHSA